MSKKVLTFSSVLCVLAIVFPTYAQHSQRWGIKAGYWIKYAFVEDGILDGDHWIKDEFLSVDPYGWYAMRETIHSNDTGEVTSVLQHPLQPEPFFSWYELVVFPEYLVTGHPIHTFLYDIRINGTTTRTYAGATREVAVASWTVASWNTIFTKYWDKATGVILEYSRVGVGTLEAYSDRVYAVETNMWSSETDGFLGLDSWIWIAIVVVATVITAIGMTVFIRHRRNSSELKSSQQELPPPPPGNPLARAHELIKSRNNARCSTNEFGNKHARPTEEIEIRLLVQ